MYCLPVGGENTLYIPTILPHILPRDTGRVDLNWRSSLSLENSASVRIHIEENDSTTQYFILNLRFYMFDESPNLEIKEQPSDTVSERKETFDIYVFLHCFIKFMQRGTCCPGLCLNIVMAAKHISSCQISLCDFVLHSHHSLPGRWTSCHI